MKSDVLFGISQAYWLSASLVGLVFGVFSMMIARPRPNGEAAAWLTATRLELLYPLVPMIAFIIAVAGFLTAWSNGIEIVLFGHQLRLSLSWG